MEIVWIIRINSIAVATMESCQHDTAFPGWSTVLCVLLFLGSLPYTNLIVCTDSMYERDLWGGAMWAAVCFSVFIGDQFHGTICPIVGFGKSSSGWISGPVFLIYVVLQVKVSLYGLNADFRWWNTKKKWIWDLFLISQVDKCKDSDFFMPKLNIINWYSILTGSEPEKLFSI